MGPRSQLFRALKETISPFIEPSSMIVERDGSEKLTFGKKYLFDSTSNVRIEYSF